MLRAEAKKGLLEHKTAFFKQKWPFGLENGLTQEKKHFQHSKGSFREKRVYLEPKGTFQANKGPF